MYIFLFFFQLNNQISLIISHEKKLRQNMARRCARQLWMLMHEMRFTSHWAPSVSFAQYHQERVNNVKRHKLNDSCEHHSHLHTPPTKQTFQCVFFCSLSLSLAMNKTFIVDKYVYSILLWPSLLLLLTAIVTFPFACFISITCVCVCDSVFSLVKFSVLALCLSRSVFFNGTSYRTHRQNCTHRLCSNKYTCTHECVLPLDTFSILDRNWIARAHSSAKYHHRHRRRCGRCCCRYCRCRSRQISTHILMNTMRLNSQCWVYSNSTHTSTNRHRPYQQSEPRINSNKPKQQQIPMKLWKNTLTHKFYTETLISNKTMFTTMLLSINVFVCDFKC